MCILTDELKRAKTKMDNLSSEHKKFLDIVDENDVVIDSKPRLDIYRLGLLHREIHVWMFDEDKNIFFQKRGLNRRTAGLLDATVGGHLGKSEEYLDAAVRETREETSVSIPPSDLVLLKKVRGTDIHRDNLISPIKNFIRCVYIYKNPVSEDQLTREAGVPGVGFQKLSFNFLMNPQKESSEIFIPFVLNDELPLVLEYLK